MDNIVYDRAEIINALEKISNEINEEQNKYNRDEDKITKLMFEQMLKGLYLQVVQPFN